MSDSQVRTEDILNLDNINPPEIRELSRYYDRCDTCQAQAFVIAIKDGLELTFCGHHGTKNLQALSDQGFLVVDHRSLINATPSPSANNE